MSPNDILKLLWPWVLAIYIDKSKYLGSVRVRLIERVPVVKRENGSLTRKWSRRVVEHIGSARSDADLAILISQANDRLTELNRAGQLGLR
ncbi:MAG: hypothetical protein HKL80_07300 [Acidimicrobiales bacterium]|nr:hypothetical protein [Acidimicrobiales bacterium]